MEEFKIPPKIIQLAIEFENGEVDVAVPSKGNSIVKNGIILKYDKNSPEYRYELLETPSCLNYYKLILYDNDTFNTKRNKLVFYVDSKEVILKDLSIKELECSYDIIDKCSGALGTYFVIRKDLYLSVITSLIREKKIKILKSNIKGL